MGSELKPKKRPLTVELIGFRKDNWISPREQHSQEFLQNKWIRNWFSFFRNQTYHRQWPSHRSPPFWRDQNHWSLFSILHQNCNKVSFQAKSRSLLLEWIGKFCDGKPWGLYEPLLGNAYNLQLQEFVWLKDWHLFPCSFLSQRSDRRVRHRLLWKKWTGQSKKRRFEHTYSSITR